MTVGNEYSPVEKGSMTIEEACGGVENESMTADDKYSRADDVT